MKLQKSPIKPTPSLKELYPGLNEAELEAAEDTLEQYIEVVLRIFNRLQSEREALLPSTLTHLEKESTMIAKSSAPP